MEGTRPRAVVVVLERDHLQGDGLKQACAFIEPERALAGGRPLLIATDSAEAPAITRLRDAGASDFLIPPLSEGNVMPRIWRLFRHLRMEREPMRRLRKRVGLAQIVGRHPDFLAEIDKIKAMSGYDASVLIEGETGTGKELCARAIHYLSPRSQGPFVPINCAAIPDELVEKELFGHQRGAYTGASETQSGLIAEAEGGTLFLDEVSSLSMLAQAKILRFLESGEYRVLGSTRIRYGDVRVIAASNVDLAEAAAEGRLRSDLYFRLNILPIRLPPLRRRVEDVPVLARHFARKYCRRFRKPEVTFSAGALEKLVLHWPGNVRELEHLVERAVLLSAASVIGEAAVGLTPPRTRPESFKEAKARVVADFERNYVRGLLVAHCGNIAAAARAARKDRRTFWELIRKYSIDVQAIKQLSALT